MFALGGTATWVANRFGLSGFWSDASHWSGQTFPNLEGTVVFLDTGAASVPWTSVIDTLTFPSIPPTGPPAIAPQIVLNDPRETLLLDISGAIGLQQSAGTLAIDAGLTAQVFGSQSGGLVLVDDATLQVGDQYLGAGTLIVRDGGTLTNSVFYLGVLASPLLTVAPTPGTLAVSGHSQVTLGSELVLAAGSVVSLDPTSTLVVAADSAVAGAVVVGAGGSLAIPDGTIAADLRLDGVLLPFIGYLSDAPADGTIVVTGTLGGTGTVGLDQSAPTYGPPIPHDQPATAATLRVASAASFGGVIGLGADDTLVLTQGGAPDATFDAGRNATIDLADVSWSAGAVATVSGAGTVTVGGDVLQIATANGQPGAAAVYQLQPDGNGGTELVIAPDPAWQPAGGAAGGAWDDAQHWSDGQVPGADQGVRIGAGGTGTAGFVVAATSVTVASLTLNAAGATLLDTGALTVSGTANTGAAAPLQLLAGVLELDGAGASLATSGVLVGNSAGASPPVATLALRDGATAALPALALAGVIDLDAASALAIGGATPVAGAVAVADPIGFGQLPISVKSGAIEGDLDLQTHVPITTATIDTLAVIGALMGTAELFVQDSLAVGSAASFAGTIVLPGNPASWLGNGGGLFRLGSGDFTAGVILIGSGTIDLAGVPWSGGLARLYDPTSGILQIGGTLLRVWPGGATLTTGNFGVRSDGQGGTDIWLVSSAEWQASGGTASGDWSDGNHWNIGAPPLAPLAVSITDAAGATTPWTVTATNESFASLLLDTATGMLLTRGQFSGSSLAVIDGTLLDDGGMLATYAATIDGGTAAAIPQVTVAGGGTFTATDLLIGVTGEGALALQGGAGAVVSATSLGLGSGRDATLAIGAGDLVSAEYLWMDGGILSLDPAGALLQGGSAAVPREALLQSATLNAGIIFGNVAGSFDQSTESDTGFLRIVGKFDPSYVTVAATLEAQSFGTARGLVDLGANALLVVDTGGVPGATINLSEGAAVDFRGVPWASNAHGLYDPLTSLVRLGSVSFHLQVGSNELPQYYLAPDGDGGTVLVHLDADYWQSARGSPGGAWSESAHWDRGAPPAAGQTAVIEPADTTAAPAAIYLDPATVSLGALVLDLGAGVLSVGQSLQASSLVVASGTLRTGPTAEVGVNTLQVLGGELQIWGGDVAVEHGQINGSVGIAGATLSFEDLGEYRTDRLGAPLDPPQTVTITVGDAGALWASLLRLSSGSVLSVQDTSSVAVGGASGVSGQPEAAADELIAERGATIEGDVAVAGTLSVVQPAFTADAFAPPAQVTGSLSGHGMLRVEDAAEIADASQFTGTIDIASALVLDRGTINPAAQIVWHNGGAIDLPDGTTLTAAGIAGGDTGSGTAPLACYAAGTPIATPEGEVPIERLRVGDLVLALGGARTHARPVRWLGHAKVALRRRPRPEAAAPIRIRAHAFADGIPHRDVLLSPDHGLLLCGMLVHARSLVNGRSIVQEVPASIVYWHLELDRHGIVLAAGLAAESYLDLGNRGSFAGEAGARPLHPDFAAAFWDAHACAPLLLPGPTLDRLRRGLDERARRAGPAPHRLLSVGSHEAELASPPAPPRHVLRHNPSHHVLHRRRIPAPI